MMSILFENKTLAFLNDDSVNRIDIYGYYR